MPRIGPPTLAAHFAEFEQASFQTAPPDFRKNMRAAFYAGAASAHLLMENSETAAEITRYYQTEPPAGS